MAIVFTEIKKGCTVKKDRQGHTATRKFQAIGTSSDTKSTVLANGSCPQIGDAHPDDSFMHVDNVTCSEEMHKANADGKLQFIVDVEYTSNFDALERATVPLSRTPEYSFGATVEQQEVYLDHSATPKLVQNSAGDKFENQPQGIISYQQVTITRNESSFALSTIYTFNGSINDASFTVLGYTIPTACARMDSISATREVETINGTTYTYWRVTYVFSLNADTWRATVYDTGYNKKVSGKKYPIVDGTGLAVQTAWPLDGSGSPKTNATDTPATISFKIYKETTWSFSF